MSMGSVSLDLAGFRPRLAADLSSQRIHLAELFANASTPDEGETDPAEATVEQDETSEEEDRRAGWRSSSRASSRDGSRPESTVRRHLLGRRVRAEVVRSGPSWRRDGCPSGPSGWLWPTASSRDRVSLLSKTGLRGRRPGSNRRQCGVRSNPEVLQSRRRGSWKDRSEDSTADLQRAGRTSDHGSDWQLSVRGLSPRRRHDPAEFLGCRPVQVHVQRGGPDR